MAKDVLAAPRGNYGLALNDKCIFCDALVKDHRFQAEIDRDNDSDEDEHKPKRRRHRDSDQDAESGDDMETEDLRSAKELDKAVMKISYAMKDQIRPFLVPNENYPTVQPFLDDMERKLSPMEATLPRTQWFRMIPALLTKCSAADAELITKEVVDTKLDWPALCYALHARFDKADYKVMLARNFANITQGHGEPLRSYINRFQNAMHLLGYAEDNATLPDLFLKGLRQSIAEKYENLRRSDRASQLLRLASTQPRAEAASAAGASTAASDLGCLPDHREGLARAR